MGAAPAPHLGPVQALLSFYAGEQYNDNINYVHEGALSDEISEFGLTSAFTWPASTHSSLFLNAGVGYSKYLNHPKYDRMELAPGSILNWDVGLEEVSLSFFDQFSYSQEVASQPAITGVASFPRIDNTMGTRATWEPGKWVLSAGCSYNNYFSDSSAYQYLNRSSEYFYARAGRLFAENTQTGVEGSVSLTHYDLSLQSDTTTYSGGGFAEWQVTRTLRLTARGGPTIYVFQSNGQGLSQSALHSYYASVEIHHNLTEYISHQLSVDRSVQLGYNQGSDYLQELKITYSANWQLTQSLTVGPGMSYVYGSQPLRQLNRSLTEDYDQFGGNFAVSWRATTKLQGSLSYSVWDRQSNLTGRNYADNTVTVRLEYNF